MNWEKIKFFKPSEFTCRCGCGKGCEEMNEQFVAALDMARKDAGVSFVIASGYRCANHNQNVGGVSDSSHTRGLAADVVTISAEHRMKVLKALLKYFDRIGVHNSFLHVDVDPDKPSNVLWTY